MCNNNNNNNLTLDFVTVITSLILAIGVGALYYFGSISNIFILFYITLALGIIGLIYVIVTLVCKKKKNCFCLKMTDLISSSVGAIISSIFALTATSLATNVLSVGYFIVSVAFFLMFTIVNFFYLIYCFSCLGKCE